MAYQTYFRPACGHPKVPVLCECRQVIGVRPYPGKEGRDEGGVEVELRRGEDGLWRPWVLRAGGWQPDRRPLNWQEETNREGVEDEMLRKWWVVYRGDLHRWAIQQPREQETK